MTEKIKLGISACLLGRSVRYDGGHKLDRLVTEDLGRYLEYVPVCPEVECGMSVPREPLRLVGDPRAPRLVTTRTRIDWTEQMEAWALERVKELASEGLVGFVFKSNSPSSGMTRVKVYTEDGIPAATGVGVFARIFMTHFPLLPAIDDGRLHDAELRENFIERLFALQRWRELLEQPKSRAGLIEFHSRHKLLLLSHSEKQFRSLGRLVAQPQLLQTDERYDRYQAEFVRALELKTSARKHANVLQHIMGYFKRQLAADEKRELLELIEYYYRGVVPLLVPITLLNHYVRKFQQPYLLQQWYLNPHPIELRLRNHV